MYVSGTSAYKTYENEYEYISPRERAEQSAKKSAYEKKKRALAITLCAYLFIVFILAAGTVYSRVLVMQAQSRVERLETELGELTEVNNNKKIQKEQSIDLKKIEELAITKYGMQRPVKNQTIYVNVVQSDYGEVVDSDFANTKDGIKSYFVSK